jgi:hypothetical protein
LEAKPLNSAVKSLLRRSSRIARAAGRHIGPIGSWDALFTGGDFIAMQGRLPRHPSREDAGIMDYFFWRKHQPWGDLERRCCDKGTAKEIAQSLSSSVKVPQTVATITLAGIKSGHELKEQVAPYLGKKLVMKPAHSNGGIVFLDDVDIDWDDYLKQSQVDFFPIARERQYYKLPPNLIIEETLSAMDGALPEDFKFFCFKGKPLMCQLDYGRFEGQKRQLFMLPEWRQLDVMYSYPAGPRIYDRPALLDEALKICEDLSAPFDFVRIDLYIIGTDIYFGEFTFTPAAGTRRFSREEFDIALGALVRSGDRDRLLPFVSRTQASAGERTDGQST